MRKEDVVIGEEYEITQFTYIYDKGDIVTVTDVSETYDKYFFFDDKTISTHCSCFEPIKKYVTGDKLYDKGYEEVVTLVGYTSDNQLVVEDIEGCIYRRKFKKVTSFKNKNDLDVGDKIKHKYSKYEYEILFKAKDFAGTIYTAKDTEENVIILIRPDEIDKIIYE